MRVRRAGVERDELPVAEVERVRLDVERCGSRSAARGRARDSSEANWSSRPVSAPTQSFSTFEQSLASALRSPAVAAAAARAPSAASSAAEDDSPLPRGRSPRDLEVRGRTRTRARSSAIIPRVKRAPALDALGRVELVALAEVERVDRPALAPACAVTVTPRSIANGIASPSL